MCDLIRRQDAIDAFYKHPNIDWTTLDVLAKINALPSAQPEKVDTPTVDTPNCDDTISRQAAIAEIARWIGYLDDDMIGRIQLGLKRLPSAQPEIVLCKDCIFHGLCRTSPKWAVAPKDDWFCADAERRTDE